MKRLMFFTLLTMGLGAMAEVYCKAKFYHQDRPSDPDICVEPNISVDMCESLVATIANALKRVDKKYFYVTYSHKYSESPLTAYFPSCDDFIYPATGSKKR